MNQLSPPIEIPRAGAINSAPGVPEDGWPSQAPRGNALYQRVPNHQLRPYPLRLALVLAVAGAATLVLALTLALVPPPRQEPELINLLRAMVLIKGAITLAAAALVWWRLGRPLAPGLAARYVAALCVSAGAVAWLWGLHLIPLGAGAFYLGLLGLYLAGRRDPLLSAPVSGRGKGADLASVHRSVHQRQG